MRTKLMLEALAAWLALAAASGHACASIHAGANSVFGAGSVLTMDQAFARLVTTMGVGLVDATTICATTPARALGLDGFGAITAGAIADLVVMDRALKVTHTFIAGALVYGPNA